MTEIDPVKKHALFGVRKDGKCYKKKQEKT